MKTMKSILIAATLISATAVSTMSAQQAAAPAYQWKVAKGDSVMIKRECDKYLTGEKPSTWVYDKVHTVGQLGTKRFPEGVLLFNINSWICEECLVPVHPREQQPQAEPAKQPEVVVKESEAVVVKETKPEVKETEAVVVKEEPVKQTPAQPVAEEPAQPATEEVKQEEAPVKEEKPAVIVEQVKGDSVKSQQNFKHGYDRFTIGLRGGASGLLHKVEKGDWTCGFDVLLDLQYAHYWAKDGRPVDLGIITGLSLGYAQSGMKSNVNSQFTYPDSDPSFPVDIDYDIRADKVTEKDGQIQLEIPLMFSLLHTNGLFFNVGPRFMIPVYTPFNQTITDNENTYIYNAVDRRNVTSPVKHIDCVFFCEHAVCRSDEVRRIEDAGRDRRRARRAVTRWAWVLTLTTAYTTASRTTPATSRWLRLLLRRVLMMPS